MNLPALSEIKARLSAATPGPWELIDSDDNQMVVKPHGKKKIEPICALAGMFARTKDFELIAHAPQDLRTLLAMLEKAIEQRNYWMGGGSFGDERKDFADAELSRLISLRGEGT